MIMWLGMDVMMDMGSTVAGDYTICLVWMMLACAVLSWLSKVICQKALRLANAKFSSVSKTRANK